MESNKEENLINKDIRELKEVHDDNNDTKGNNDIEINCSNSKESMNNNNN